MLANDAGFPQSVIAIVDFFAREALASFRYAGVVAAWSDRERGPVNSWG
jgi:hypothetical protein